MLYEGYRRLYLASIKDVLTHFKNDIGMMVNMSKSTFTAVGLSQDEHSYAQSLFPFQLTSPIDVGLKYLGSYIKTNDYKRWSGIGCRKTLK